MGVALFAALSSFGATRTFNGSWDVEPSLGDDIVVTGGALSWTASMPQQVNSWTQSGGTVTFETTYAETFPKLVVAGNVSLSGGMWTHPLNSTQNQSSTYLNRTYRLYVSVGGTMTVGADATIDVTGCGYRGQFMAAGGTGPISYAGGTYGGRGGNNDGNYICEPYGKYWAPEEPGSGMANYTAGGGAIRLDVAGLLTNNGRITAQGGGHNAGYYNGSGGSVYINAGAIAGTGTLAANSDESGKCKSWSSGSGGRIAVILHDAGADFSNYDIETLASAYSGTVSSNNMGAPGTIYAETAADTPQHGWLIVKNNGGALVRNSAPSVYNYAEPFAYGESGTLSFGKLSILGNTLVRIPTGKTLDLRETEVVMDDKMKVGFYLAGGAILVDETAHAVDYKVATECGLAGFKTETLSFVAGSSLTVNGAEGDAFDGDVVFTGNVKPILDAPLAVAGDLTVGGGAVLSCTGPLAENQIQLTLRVGGDLTVEADGKIDVTGKGYTKNVGPADRLLPQSTSTGSSHGGRGSSGIGCPDVSQVIPYGSIYNPREAGASSDNLSGYGGGILVLEVGGTLTVDGGVIADAAAAGTYGGGGGSVNVTAGALAGAGLVTAHGSLCNWNDSDACGPAGGGRIAVTLTETGADFTDFTGTIGAWGGRGKKNLVVGKHIGAAGTVYLRAGGEAIDGGKLIVDNPLAGMTGYYETPVGIDIEGKVFGSVKVGRSARLELYENETMKISGDFENNCEFVADAGSTVELVGSGVSTLSGDITFQNLSCTTAGKTIEVAAGATITVDGVLNIIGAANDELVTIMSTEAGVQWNLVPSGGAILSNVRLCDCNSSAAIAVVNGVNGGNNSANITFLTVTPGQTVTWTGAASANWADAGNWDMGRSPVPTDLVVIPKGVANMPVLGMDVEVAQLTVASGATLSLGGRNLTVTGWFEVGGTLVATASETLTAGGYFAIPGAFVPATSTVVLNGAGTQDLRADGVTFHAIRVEGPEAGFIGNISAVLFEAGGTQELSFYKGCTYAFNSFAVRGDAATPSVTLRSQTNGAVWYLKVNAADVTGAIVSDSDATKGVTIVPAGCADSGNNAGWLFIDNRTHWTGAKNSDFADAANWSDGVPTAGKGTVIEGTVPVKVTAAGAVGELTVATGAKMTVSAPFEVTGSVTVEKSAELAWDVPGTIAGNLVVLEGGVLTHTAAAANDAVEKYHLDLVVGGDGYIAEGGAISVEAKGFQKNKGPGAPNGNNGAAHAGRATDNLSVAAYGSYLFPTNWGSGGNYSSGAYAGGGAAKLVFGGKLTLDGEISADGLHHGGAQYYTSAGGSIWIEAASLSGKGDIHADGSECDSSAKGYRYGSGGRIAVKLTEAESFDGYAGKIYAYGGRHCAAGSYLINAAPGSIYLETAADPKNGGKVIISNEPGKVDSANNYEKFAVVDLPSSRLCDSRETEKATFEIDGYSIIYLTADTKVEDIHILDANSKLKLNGHTLKVHTRRHAVSPNDDMQIIPDEGGEIVWFKGGTMILVW